MKKISDFELAKGKNWILAAIGTKDKYQGKAGRKIG